MVNEYLLGKSSHGDKSNKEYNHQDSKNEEHDEDGS